MYLLLYVISNLEFLKKSVTIFSKQLKLQLLDF